jgi:hypothetical protein
MSAQRVRTAARLASVAAFRDAQARQELAVARRERDEARAAVEEAERAMVWIEHRRQLELEKSRVDSVICAWLDEVRVVAASALAARESLSSHADERERQAASLWRDAHVRQEGTAARAEAIFTAHVSEQDARIAARATETWLALARGQA